MPVVRAEIEIDAPPERVFDILADIDRYGEWNPFTPRIESTLEIGAPVKMHVHLTSDTKAMHQTEYVTANERPHKLCWGADIIARFLVRADRCQTLTALEGGRTHYECTDEIQGWLAPVVMKFYGEPMRRGFQRCAEALKKRAEAGPDLH